MPSFLYTVFCQWICHLFCSCHRRRNNFHSSSFFYLAVAINSFGRYGQPSRSRSRFIQDSKLSDPFGSVHYAKKDRPVIHSRASAELALVDMLATPTPILNISRLHRGLDLWLFIMVIVNYLISTLVIPYEFNPDFRSCAHLPIRGVRASYKSKPNLDCIYGARYGRLPQSKWLTSRKKAFADAV